MAVHLILDIKEKLLSSIIKNDYEILNYDITLPDLSSRIIEDLSFSYTMMVKIPESKIKAGNVLPISLKKNLSLFMTKEDAVSAIHLGPPRIFETYITLENIDLSEEKDLNCHLDSPWANLSRTIQYEKDKHRVLIHKKMEVKKSWIEDTELGSDAYKQFIFESKQSVSS